MKFFVTRMVIVAFTISFFIAKAADIPARNTLLRIVGENNIEKFHFTIDNRIKNGYSIKIENNKIYVSASDQVALCRGAYDYLSNVCNSMVSWSGNRIQIPTILPSYSAIVESPYKYHYYLNVVTHGYSMPYWDWERWEQEIDWMAVHGINMPLMSGAHEAILYRVFKKLGLNQTEIDSYFTGPAHLPWNRMGNITGWDGSLTDNFYKKQVALFHQILNRVKELNMHPIIPAFAGFIPQGINRIYPNEKVRELKWGGFNKKYQAYILEPGSPLFIKIGKMYIEEWEKEFGKNEFYLADSFNEMDVPLSENKETALAELSGYGESVYRSIKEANKDAVWVMQGWTFPYQQKDGKLFWTPERLNALISKVPNDKLLMLDLANEYNKEVWKIEPSWKMYNGFWGKQWIYSFIPNMGGKTSLNGMLNIYANLPYEAINYSQKGNLVGFGFAPEGIDNNEIIYELLSDVGWNNKPFELNNWIKKYSLKRYGAFPEKMEQAFALFLNSCYGSFTPHPRQRYQFRPDDDNTEGVNQSEDFGKGVALFLECASECKDSKLYQSDAIEFVAQYAGIRIDNLLKMFRKTGAKDDKLLAEAIELMYDVDKLLASHPTWRLERWENFAINFGKTKNEKQHYLSNARRLITTWGGGVNEYAAKTWSGLIRDYYIPRWKMYYDAKKKGEIWDIKAWEENWIQNRQLSKITPYNNPLQAAGDIYRKASKE